MSSNSHILTIIIPVYNAAKYVEKCARSLFSQSLKDIEYIFVDDCTPDNSIQIIRETIIDFPDRLKHIKIISHPKNQGLTIARNTGLSNANGKYITYCDSDDWVEVDMYEKLLSIAIQDDLDLVYCDMMMHFGHNKKEVYHSADFSLNKTEVMRNYISSVWTSVVNVIVKKDIYDTYSLSSPISISYCEDYWLSVRLFHYANKIGKIPLPLYNYNRINNNSVMHNLNAKTERDERIVNLETISFFKREGMFKLYEKQLCWRLLKSTHDAIYYPGRYIEFLEIFPYSHKFIWSCPYINIKSKILMWMLSHNLKSVALLILNIRNWLGR